MASSSHRENTDAKTRYSAPALDKGLDILELLAGETEGLTQSEIARALSRTTGEIFRMLLRLAERGYVHRDGNDDRYRLTAKLFELAHRHPPTRRLLEFALPKMRALAFRIEQSCHLGIRHGDMALVVAQVDGPGPFGFAVRVGAQVPLVDSASGITLLAFCDPGLRATLLDQSPLRGKERADLEAHLETVARRGYEQRSSSVHRGIRDISAPILDPTGTAVAALTAPCLTRLKERERTSEQREALLATAAEISLVLGG